MAFVHLHVHTEYSLLDGLAKIPQLVAKVKESGMNALAITDHGSLYGAIEFYKQCQKEEIKPIIGIEAYITAGSRFNRQKDNPLDRTHLTLLAQDLTGYRNLIQLTTKAHLEGYYYKPRIDQELLEKHQEGIICLSGCPKGELAQLLSQNQYSQARNRAMKYLDIFGQDRYYLELFNHPYEIFAQNHPQGSKIRTDLENQAQMNQKVLTGLVRLSRDLGIPLVATNDVHYIAVEDAEAQDVLVCIQTNKIVSDVNRLRYIDIPDLYLKTEAEMRSQFPDLTEAIGNTQKIADRCSLKLSLGHWFFPKYQLEENTNPDDELKRLTFLRVKSRYRIINKEIKDRLDYELKVIADKGYSPYFLIFAEIVNWANDQGILTNTRGSAAGSLVSYSIGITTVDPLKFNLPFERFLNPQRPSAPDIDLDLADDRREEVITWLREKYGQDKVAQICTFGRMLARQAVRDVGRVLGMPYSQPDRLAKMIPLGSQGFPMTIEKALVTTIELKKAYDEEQNTKKVLDLARKLEGNARHASVHAAGLVISPSKLTDFVPLQLEPKGEKVITQYEMNACEDVGLVKLDLLGIRNLSIMGKAVEIITQEREVVINLKSLPQNDKLTYKLLATGSTVGLFQLGGRGMTRYLKELKPSRIEDVMAMVALFRPGPMQSIPEFISRKHNSQKITYLDPRLAEILKISYGVITYQDDVLTIAIIIAGYSWLEADKLRKAMGKKIPEEMARQKDKFIKGCVEHGRLSENKAQKLWSLIEPFAAYGFNKSHAASYAQIAYQTAYLKAHYPVEFMTAVLTAEAGNTDKIVLAVNECKRLGITVLPPNVNTSQRGFLIEKLDSQGKNRGIRFGLSAIKNVGDKAIDSILDSRNKDGPFRSLANFCQRVDLRLNNKRVIESLIKAGTMDAFGERAAMLTGLDNILNQCSLIKKKQQNGQASLFDDLDNSDANSSFDSRLPQVSELSGQEKLAFEKELFGFYLTDHPYRLELSKITDKVEMPLGELDPNLHQGLLVTVGGVIANVRHILTKKANSEMCFATLEDENNSVDLVVFPRVFAKTKNLWLSDQLVIIRGKVDVNQDRLTIIVEEAHQPQSLDLKVNKDLIEIRLPHSASPSILVALNDLLQKYPGEDRLVLKIRGQKEKDEIIKVPFGVNFSTAVAQEVENLLKECSVR